MKDRPFKQRGRSAQILYEHKVVSEALAVQFIYIIFTLFLHWSTAHSKNFMHAKS